MKFFLYMTFTLFIALVPSFAHENDIKIELKDRVRIIKTLYGEALLKYNQAIKMSHPMDPSFGMASFLIANACIAFKPILQKDIQKFESQNWKIDSFNGIPLNLDLASCDHSTDPSSLDKKIKINVSGYEKVYGKGSATTLIKNFYKKSQ